MLMRSLDGLDIGMALGQAQRIKRDTLTVSYELQKCTTTGTSLMSKFSFFIDMNHCSNVTCSEGLVCVSLVHHQQCACPEGTTYYQPLGESNCTGKTYALVLLV